MTVAFKFTPTKIPEVIIIEPEIYEDKRGFFTETYKYPDFKENGIDKTFAQVNHSKSEKNILRGLHYQINPMAQGKLVTVIEGEIFDVAVDIRQGSPTFGKWVGEYLDATRKTALYLPEGFAHGFVVTSQTAQVIYYCTEVYAPEHERGLIWNDATLGIQWPVDKPILSKKDAVAPEFNGMDDHFRY